MAKAVDTLHRRPAGPRLLLYLDQSALSRLAEGRFPELLAALEKGLHAGSLICIESGDHEYETVLADERYFAAIADLSDKLSMGVRFLDRERVWRNEVEVAAAAFLDLPPPIAIWKEAFEKDPHAPLDELFPVHGMRVSFKAEKVDWLEEEAAEDKEISLGFQPAWDTARAAGVTFEEQVEREFEGHVHGWRLRPIADPAGFRAWLARSGQETLVELGSGQDVTRSGSAFNRHAHRKGLAEFSEYLLREYPGLRGCEQNFLRSQQLRSAPSLRYPALLMAALCCTPRRKAKAGDLYDVYHLTRGLSRCDILTADGGMTQLCRDWKLVPAGVRLFSSRELGDLASHLETILSR